MTGGVRIILARHGESAWNVEDRYQGHADSGLTSQGHAQARALAEHLSATLGSTATCIVSSDLARAQDTAAPFAAASGLEVSLDPRLREVSTGSWTGQTFAQVARSHPDDVAAAARGVDVRRGGGETFGEVRARVWAALSELADELGTTRGGVGRPTAVVFTHGGAIRVASAAASGVPSPGHTAFSPPVNCSLAVLDLEGGRSRVTAYGIPAVTDAFAARAE